MHLLLAHAKAPDCRSSVIAALEMLSSPAKQLAYEHNVQTASVPDELVSMWFDDVYLPDSSAFRDCFSEDELAAMAAFSQFYDVHLEELPDARNGVSGWLDNRTWNEITQRAGKLLINLRH